MIDGHRVLMLGATGTIGRATVRELAARGHECTTVRLHRGKPSLLIGGPEPAIPPREH